MKRLFIWPIWCTSIGQFYEAGEKDSRRTSFEGVDSVVILTECSSLVEYQVKCLVPGGQCCRRWCFGDFRRECQQIEVRSSVSRHNINTHINIDHRSRRTEERCRCRCRRRRPPDRLEASAAEVDVVLFLFLPLSQTAAVSPVDAAARTVQGSER